MEQTIEFYGDCVKALLSQYAPLKTESSQVELIFDDERMRYTAIRVGWFRGKRVHRCLIHIDVCDDTVIIQANNTESEIDTELIEMGVPKEKIRLGFIPPAVLASLGQAESEKQLEPV